MTRSWVDQDVGFVRIAFMVTHVDLDPGAVTSTLGIPPPLAHIGGGPRVTRAGA